MWRFCNQKAFPRRYGAILFLHKTQRESRGLAYTRSLKTHPTRVRLSAVVVPTLDLPSCGSEVRPWRTSRKGRIPRWFGGFSRPERHSIVRQEKTEPEKGCRRGWKQPTVKRLPLGTLRGHRQRPDFCPLGITVAQRYQEPLAIGGPMPLPRAGHHVKMVKMAGGASKSANISLCFCIFISAKFIVGRCT